MLEMIFSFFYSILIWLLPFIGVALLVFISYKLWMHYIKQDFISGITWTLLEIIPPREVLRSPRAMELFLSNAFYHHSEKSGLEVFWQGAVHFWFSLEIASIDGQVRFFIRTPTRIKDLIETQMYAQYPQSQVREVLDYTLGVDEITEKSNWNLWGCEFILEKPEAYPIKTYIDFNLDKESKEELKIDPISSIIELFASIQKGEQMWLQYVVRPAMKKYPSKGEGWFKYHDWVKEAELTIRERLNEFTKINERADGTISKEIRAPAFLDEIVKASTKKITKLGFDTGIRVCYIAKKEIFPLGTRTNNSRNIRLIFRQFTNPFSNGLTRVESTQADAYGGFYLASPKIVMLLADRMLKKFRKRTFFHVPLRYKIFSKKYVFWPFSIWFKAFSVPETFVLNVEELATLWHFPGQILKVPTFERIESKEAAPPTNLPI